MMKEPALLDILGLGHHLINHGVERLHFGGIVIAISLTPSGHLAICAGSIGDHVMNMSQFLERAKLCSMWFYPLQ